MCGINLIFDRHNKVDASLISKMAESTSHRGPDETITMTIRSANYTFHLAANRLKITDQTNAAAQPFMLEDQKHVLLFNGEIYNYRELRRELTSLGHQFCTESDTEVIVHLLASPRQHKSEDAMKATLRRLEGAFSLVMHSFFVLFNAFIGVLFLPRANRELFDETTAATQSSAA